MKGRMRGPLIWRTGSSILLLPSTFIIPSGGVDIPVCPDFLRVLFESLLRHGVWADRNVCPTAAGVEVSGPHLKSAGVGVGIGIEWNDRGSGHAKPQPHRTAVFPVIHGMQENDTASDTDPDTDGDCCASIKVKTHQPDSRLRLV